MCGIAGFIPSTPTPIDSRFASALFHRLQHRGPDDRGFLLFSGTEVRLGRNWIGQETAAKAVLLHQRLSILDLTETGWQPMGTPDGRYYIVFNGEIYNYLELRQELEKLGCQFRSRSDTEVLLFAYAEWGPQVLCRLVGMFAFAVLDIQEEKLFLARDFFGVKPLYYSFGSHGFGFCSEIRGLLELPGISRNVNPSRVYLYLRYGLTDHGPETLFADIRQIPPAHYLEVPLRGPWPTRPVQYWDVDLNHRLDISFEQAAERLRHLFLESIQLHLRSDVPVGAALSGGIDSSSIVIAMRHLQGKQLDLHTFSYIANTPSLSEEQWIDQVGYVSQAVVHKIQLSATDLAADIVNLIRVQGEPFATTSIYAQNRVFELARTVGIKVMLDGQGADELLGGYPVFTAARLASLVRHGRWGEAIQFFQRATQWPGRQRLWLQAGQFLLPSALQDPFRRLVGHDLMPAWLNRDWFVEREVSPQPLHRSHGHDILRKTLYQTLTESSLPALLRYEDRNSMAYSIESRVPFLTPALVNFIFALPEEFIIASDGCSKAVFRQSMRGIVPDAILDRRDKIGFVTPEQHWLSLLRPWVDQVLGSEVAQQIPAIVLKVVNEDWASVRAGRRPFNSRIWRWLNLIEWTREFEVSFP